MPAKAKAARAPRTAAPAPPVFIKWFRELSIGDIPLVGGKNASLGEMFRELAPKGVKVPDGFAITSDAYRHFLRSADLMRKSRASSAASTRATWTTFVSAATSSATPFSPPNCRQIWRARF